MTSALGLQRSPKTRLSSRHVRRGKTSADGRVAAAAAAIDTERGGWQRPQTCRTARATRHRRRRRRHRRTRSSRVDVLDGAPIVAVNCELDFERARANSRGIDCSSLGAAFHTSQSPPRPVGLNGNTRQRAFKTLDAALCGSSPLILDCRSRAADAQRQENARCFECATRRSPTSEHKRAPKS